MLQRYAFTDPFKRHHCVVLAWAHVAELGTDGATLLAEYAYAEPTSRRASGARMSYGIEGKLPLLNMKGGGWLNTEREADQWANLAGMLIVDTITHPGLRTTEQRNYYGNRREVTDTLAQFAKDHPAGRWVITVDGHCVALIDGLYYGHYAPRSRVITAWRVEVAT